MSHNPTKTLTILFRTRLVARTLTSDATPGPGYYETDLGNGVICRWRYLGLRGPQGTTRAGAEAIEIVWMSHSANYNGRQLAL